METKNSFLFPEKKRKKKRIFCGGFETLLTVQVKHSLVNPLGCWDWWGYLGEALNLQYATKRASQMAAVARMVADVADINMF